MPSRGQPTFVCLFVYYGFRAQRHSGPAYLTDGLDELEGRVLQQQMRPRQLREQLVGLRAAGRVKLLLHLLRDPAATEAEVRGRSRRVRTDQGSDRAGQDTIRHGQGTSGQKRSEPGGAQSARSGQNSTQRDQHRIGCPDVSAGG